MRTWARHAGSKFLVRKHLESAKQCKRKCNKSCFRTIAPVQCTLQRCGERERATWLIPIVFTARLSVLSCDLFKGQKHLAIRAFYCEGPKLGPTGSESAKVEATRKSSPRPQQRAKKQAYAYDLRGRPSRSFLALRHGGSRRKRSDPTRSHPPTASCRV